MTGVSESAEQPPRGLRALRGGGMSGELLVVTGTGTGVGKTIVTAALAAVAHANDRSVVIVKPAQSGVSATEEGDLEQITALTGITRTHEFARYEEPLAPAAAARISGKPALTMSAVARSIQDFAESHDLVLVEGAGGLLVEFNEAGETIADLAQMLDAEVVLVTAAGLGTLNHTALTVEALKHRNLLLAGVVIGDWPADPDLACRTNLEDLPRVIGQDLAGAIPANSGQLEPAEFLTVARLGLAPKFGGQFDGANF